jgi:hypothetical protein
MKFRIVMAKAVFNKKRVLFTSKLDLKLRKKLIKCYIERELGQSALNRCTVQPFTESDVTRCCENTIGPPEDGHVTARNMSRIVV